ncbi:MAG: GNAT family N-acetyltransferase [Candidatus Sericytochromatia bacterium]|nr:GNAT family N-acetyltransferase [Candidatus Sericytochromatia bacterium]
MSGTTFIYGKPLNEREVGDFHRILSQSYAWPTDPLLNPAAEEGMANLRLLRRAARVIGGLSLQPCRQYFGGRAISMAGVRIVAIAPDMRGQGAASTLMEACVREHRERGWVLSTLYPEMRGLYRKSGYEVAGDSHLWQLPLDAPVQADRTLTLKPFDLGSASGMAAMRNLYEAQAQFANGWLERSDWYWSRIFREAPEQGAGNRVYAYLLERETSPEGYLIYSQPEVGARRYRLKLHDWVATTPAARRRILCFLADHRSMADAAELYGGPTDPLLLGRDAPLAPTCANHPWMLRIVDVQAALEQRGYAAGVGVELHLGIRDGLIKENERPFVLTVEAGRSAVRVGGEARIMLDVRGLAALFTGHVTPQALKGLGLVEGSDADLAKLGAAFSGPQPWMPERF